MLKRGDVIYYIDGYGRICYYLLVCQIHSNRWYVINLTCKWLRKRVYELDTNERTIKFNINELEESMRKEYDDKIKNLFNNDVV